MHRINRVVGTILLALCVPATLMAGGGFLHSLTAPDAPEGGLKGTAIGLVVIGVTAVVGIFLRRPPVVDTIPVKITGELIIPTGTTSATA